MATNDPFGLTASGIPLELQAEYRGLTRQQAIQEALMKQGLNPGGEPINAGKFIVRRSPLEGLAKVLQAYMGQRGLAETDAKFGELGKRAQDMTAQEVMRYMETKNGAPAKPEIPMPPEEAGGGPGREAMPATAGDPRAAITQAMLSRNPAMQKLGALDYAQMAKPPEKIDAGNEWVFMRDGAIVGRLPKSATPDALTSAGTTMLTHTTPSANNTATNATSVANTATREAGDMARFAGVSGNNTATNATSVANTATREAGDMARFAGVSGNTSAQIRAQEALRAAQALAARAQAGAAPINAAANAANANYSTGSNIVAPGLPAAPASAGTSWNGAPLRTEADARAAVGTIPQGPAVPPGADAAQVLFNSQPGMPLTAEAAAPTSPRARDQAILDANRATAARDNRPPSAAAQRAILDADQAVLATQQVAGYLKQARELNEKAMGFPGASAVATVGSFLPQGQRPQAVNDTQILDNVVQTSVLPQLKLVFGGNPTEGERKILLDVAGSSSKNPAVRKVIFDNAEKAANERLKFNTERAQKLRSGTYFTSGTQGAAEPAQTTIPQRRVDDSKGGVRRYNPATGRIE